MKRIFVGNLPFELNEDELRGLFEEHGEVASINLITDRYSGQFKGFGFVEMADDEAADNAIANLNDTEFGGRRMRVDLAKARERRGGGGGGGGRGGFRGGRGGGGGRDRY